MARHSTRPEAATVRVPPAVDTLPDAQRERRARIIGAAQQLMVAVDYDRIQVKDVADRAEVALGTLYRYFNSKDHLFACALVDWSESFGQHMAFSTTGPTVDRVKAIFRLAARAFERQPRVYAVLMQVQNSTDRHADEVFATFARQQNDAFGRALETSRLSERKRQDVVAVMGAVLDENLRSWQGGRQPIDGVYEAIERAAELIFGR
jgi:TetR/AcrR family transcriptional regulator, cholesterol catabolism regulator